MDWIRAKPWSPTAWPLTKACHVIGWTPRPSRCRAIGPFRSFGRECVPIENDWFRWSGRAQGHSARWATRCRRSSDWSSQIYRRGRHQTGSGLGLLLGLVARDTTALPSLRTEMSAEEGVPACGESCENDTPLVLRAPHDLCRTCSGSATLLLSWGAPLTAPASSREIPALHSATMQRAA